MNTLSGANQLFTLSHLDTVLGMYPQYTTTAPQLIHRAWKVKTSSLTDLKEAREVEKIVVLSIADRQSVQIARSFHSELLRMQRAKNDCDDAMPDGSDNAPRDAG